MPPPGKFLCVTAAARPRNRRRFIRAALFTIVGLLIGSSASSYRFTHHRPDGSVLVPDAEGAIRWSAEHWPAGGVLEWVVTDDPGWTSPWEHPWDGDTRPPPFENTADALPFLREAMAAWSGIPTADIRWRLSGVAPGPGDARDGRNTVSALPAEYNYAQAWWQWDSERWTITECDIVLASGFSAAELGSDWPANLAVMIHELGHCIGLQHTPTYSYWAARSFEAKYEASFDAGILGEAPTMGRLTAITNAIASDDIVGASLLRPSAGWMRRTGAISGRVTVSGEPARFAVVGSVRLTAEGAMPGPSVFTNTNGLFRLEGLVPGNYLIRAGPIVYEGAHPRLVAAGARLQVADVFRMNPVPVRAGEETDDISLALPPGRQSTREVRR